MRHISRPTFRMGSGFVCITLRISIKCIESYSSRSNNDGAGHGMQNNYTSNQVIQLLNKPGWNTFFGLVLNNCLHRKCSIWFCHSPLVLILKCNSISSFVKHQTKLTISHPCDISDNEYFAKSLQTLKVFSFWVWFQNGKV